MEVKTRYPLVFSLCTIIILAGSLSLAHDKFNWVLEVFPILLGFPVLFFTYRRFRLTGLLYGLLIVHFIVLSVGGIYTYAQVPLGFWMQEWFHFGRNNYDKIGHFMQGFVPALLIREVLLGTSTLQRGKWLNFIVVSICLAISAMYELIEWWTAAVQGASAEAFLGTQGYAWDAQSDMFFALIGAMLAVAALSRLQDRFLQRLATGARSQKESKFF
jgi:putative membrane protein